MSLFHRRININAPWIPSDPPSSRPSTCGNNIRGLDAVRKKRISFIERAAANLYEWNMMRCCSASGDSPGNRDCTVMNYECHSAGMNTGCLLDALQEAFQIELEKTHRLSHVSREAVVPPTPMDLVWHFDREGFRGKARPGRNSAQQRFRIVGDFFSEIKLLGVNKGRRKQKRTSNMLRRYIVYCSD